MKNIVLILIVSLLWAGAGYSQPRSLSPRQLFPGLFEEVQTSHTFPDSKTFADAVPKKSPSLIIQEWKAASQQSGFDLKAFVYDHFYIPEPVRAIYKTDTGQSVQQHIQSLWSVLQRNPDADSSQGSLIPLPHRYIVPGGRFREVYYWDSYFTMLGLKESGRTDLMENILDNFAYLINTYGFIPNGNRTYYLTRSQPPFFSLMVQLLMESRPIEKHTVLMRYRDALEKEYMFWMKDSSGSAYAHVVHLPGGVILNRYWDRGNWPREEAWTEDLRTAAQSGRNLTTVYHELRSGAESGWDFSSRWLADGKSLSSIHVTDIIPVDLNCLLYNLEELLSEAYKGSAKSLVYHRAALRRIKAIQQYCWDKKTGWFYDYDFVAHKHTNSLNLAGMYPLFFKIARTGQADSARRVLQREFLRPGGLVTTANPTGQQWDSPNGWAPLQWVSISGLLRYHKDSLAYAAAGRWAGLNNKTFLQTGKLLEKYNVADTTLIGGGGEYPNQDGFGWTNGVLLKVLHLHAADTLRAVKLK
jgi:alpha,alpha-trehalase